MLNVNLLAVHHYLQALDYQRTANKVVALLSDSSTKLWSVVYSGSAWSVGNKGAALALAPLLAATNTVPFSLDFQIK